MTSKKTLLSIAPRHNEEESVPLFYEKTVFALKTMRVDHQLLFIDDGSRGKNLEKKMEEVYNFHVARHTDRSDEHKILSFLSYRFYNVLNKLSDPEIIVGSMDFGHLNKRTSDVILSISEYSCCSNNYFIFSNQPLNIDSRLGFIITLFALVYLVFVIVKYCLYGDPVQGWTTMMCVMLFLGGVQLLIMGIIGQYLGKTYLEVKKRPVYILGESSKDGEDGE